MSQTSQLLNAPFRNENTVWNAMQNDAMDEFDRSYDEAVVEARKALGATYANIIGGAETTSDSGTFDDHNPSNPSELLGRFQKSGPAEVASAVSAAREAYPAWSALEWKERCTIFHRAAQRMRERKFWFGAWMSLEVGKNRIETMNDVDEAIDFLDFYPTSYAQNDGFVRTLGKPFPNEDCRSVLKPFGVWGVISPFNFPVAINVGMTAGPTLVGNTTVVKPASDTPLVAHMFVKMLHEVGVPPGVVNYVAGPGSSVGNAIVNHPDVAGVVFTGSKSVGMAAHTRMTARNKSVIAEMGGKNAIVVTPKADLDKAVEGVGRSAFGFGGQKCSACSRIYLHEDIRKEFTDRLVEWTKRTCTTGDPTRKEVFLGPLVNEKTWKDFERYAQKAKQGGKILIGGERVTDPSHHGGYFAQATIVDGLADDHELTTTELFVPITSIYGFTDMDEVLARVNSVEYGLTAGIFSEDPAEVEAFMAGVEAGVVYSNRRMGGSTGAVVGGQSFGGWKNSGTTGRGAGGPYYLMQFLREQSQTRVS